MKKRKLVNVFSAKMEDKMAVGDNKKPQWWEDRGLFNKLENEVEELWVALQEGTPESIVEEAADVANFAMMIAGKANPRWRKFKNE